MTASNRVFFSSLTNKTRDELSEVLADADREALLDLVFSLVTLERLVGATTIARETGLNKRRVLADMKAGAFVDRIFGPGFFCTGRHSFRVSVSAANAWRESFFVRARRAAIPAQKKNARASVSTAELLAPAWIAAAELLELASAGLGVENDVSARSAEQRADLDHPAGQHRTGGAS